MTLPTDRPDELDDLKAAMKAAAPRPDAAKRAADLALARDNFSRLHGEKTSATAQGSAAQPRQSSEPTHKGIFRGAMTMFDKMTTKGGLVATTAIFAGCLLILTPDGRDLLRPGPLVVGEGDTGEVPAPVTEQEEEVGEEDVAGAQAENLLVEQEPSERLGSEEIIALADQIVSETSAAPEAEPEIAMADEMMAESEGYDDTIVVVPPPASMQAMPQARALGGTMSLEAAPPMAPPSPAPAPENSLFIAGGADLYGQTNLTPGDGPVMAPEEPNTEAFPDNTPANLKVTLEEPVSTFSIDVDTASWGIIRSSLTAGFLPPEGAVRLEEMINFFPYDYAPPDGDHPFAVSLGVMDTPWNAGTQIVRIGIQGELPVLEERPPLNLVFLIDTSGSMEAANKLPLLKQSFRLMLSELRPDDEVAIVTYAGSAGRVLDPTPAGERSTILAALDQLSAGGSTNGQGGLEQAYATADEMFEDGEVSRILLATDGDFNVGLSDPRGLIGYIEDKRESGTYLSVLGFGRGNLDDATMQALAQNGNGTAAYIDTLSEAQKVLVDQLSGALFPIADDVKIQVEWNPAEIAEYRLIGYETRALAREDFRNDAVDAGELGAGHAVTALYEVTPVGSPARLTDPLRYGTAEPVAETSDELGFLRLRYKAPGEDTSVEIAQPILGDEPADTETRFAAAIAGFGELLRGSNYMGDWDYDAAIELASEARGEDAFGYRTEAVQLMRLAESLSN